MRLQLVQTQALKATTTLLLLLKTTTQVSTDSTAKECKKCGHVLFGSWEQDGNEANGKETIEWLKLGSPKTDSTQLILSLYALEYKQFDPSTTVWKDSNIRTWLNTEAGGFYESAFSATEKNKIDKTVLDDVSTEDSVFLLSSTDAKNTDYFVNAEARRCYFSPQIFDSSYYYSQYRLCDWWLRSAKKGYSGQGVVYSLSKKDNYTYSYDTIAVGEPAWLFGIRPALYFKVS